MASPAQQVAGRRVGQALAQASETLRRAGVEAPRLTAEVLLANALDCERVELYSRPERELDEDERRRFSSALERRAAGTPTEHITEVKEFFGLEFEVSPAVLIPRPETELLVEAVLERIEGTERIWDVGCGSGAIAAALAKNAPAARIVASDLSTAALAAARRNAARHSVMVRFVLGDLLAAVAPGTLDVVVSNPPYVALSERADLPRETMREPAEALFAGEDGLAVYRRLIPQARRALRPGGLLALELGHRSRAPVERMLASAPWREILVRQDLAGIDRLLLTRK